MATDSISMKRSSVVGLLVLIVLAVGASAWHLLTGGDGEYDEIPEVREMQAAIATCLLYHLSSGVDVLELDAARVEQLYTGYRVVLETKAGDDRRCTVSGKRVTDAS